MHDYFIFSHFRAYWVRFAAGNGHTIFIFPILLVILFSPFSAIAGETFYVSHGPGGGWRVSTPLEDYDIVPVGGGAYWVGTEHEYTKAIVIAWAQNHGFRQAHIQGEKSAAAVFVPASSFKA